MPGAQRVRPHGLRAFSVIGRQGRLFGRGRSKMRPKVRPDRGLQLLGVDHLLARARQGRADPAAGVRRAHRRDRPSLQPPGVVVATHRSITARQTAIRSRRARLDGTLSSHSSGAEAPMPWVGAAWPARLSAVSLPPGPPPFPLEGVWPWHEAAHPSGQAQTWGAPLSQRSNRAVVASMYVVVFAGQTGHAIEHSGRSIPPFFALAGGREDSYPRYSGF